MERFGSRSRRAASIAACIAALVCGCGTAPPLGISDAAPGADAGIVSIGADGEDGADGEGPAFEPSGAGFELADGPTTLALEAGAVSLRGAEGEPSIPLLGTTRIHGLGSEVLRLATHEARRLEWDHGHWSERFDVVPGGLEQTWVLEREIDAAGQVHIEVPLGEGARVRQASPSEVMLATGERVIRYGALHAFDATGRTLDATLSASGDHLSIDVDATDAAYPVTVDPLIAVVRDTLLPRRGSSATFGASLAVDGGRAVVGDPGLELSTTQPGGFVHLYETGWASPIRSCDGIALPSSAGAARGDRFGESIALSGDLLVVGAPGSARGRGAVWVIDLSRGFAPVERRIGAGLLGDSCSYIPNSVELLKGPMSSRGFGRRVAFSGSRIVVSSDATTSVWTYTRSGALWELESTLSAPAGAAGFGASIAVSGAVVVVGAPASSGGGAYAFTRTGSAWSAAVRVEGVAGDTETGRVVALSGRDLWVSSLRSERPTLTRYRVTGSTWGVVDDVSGRALGSIASASAKSSVILAGAPTLTGGEIIGNRTLDIPAGAGQLGAAVATDGQFALVSYQAIRASGRVLGSLAGEPRVLLMRMLSAQGDVCRSGSSCASGLCVDGVCCQSACGGGASDCQACSVASGGTTNGVCTALSARAAPEVVCREAVASCDAPEVCSAGSMVCPADRIVAAGTTCGAASGVSAVCGGESVACPGELAPADDGSVAELAELMGADEAGVDAVVALNQQMNALSREQRSRVWCRNARIFERRTPLVLLALQQSGASDEELEQAAAAIRESAAEICTGRDPDSGLRALGRVGIAANHRMTAGTALEGHEDVFMGSLLALSEEFRELCMADAPELSIEAFADMPESEFESGLEVMALGRCGRRASGGGRLDVGSTSRGYGQCVSDVMRSSAARSMESCNDPAAGGGTEEEAEGGGDGEGDGDGAEEEPHPQPNPPPTPPNPALDEHDREEAERAEGMRVLGATLVIGGIIVTAIAATNPVSAPGVAAGMSLIVVGLNTLSRSGDIRAEARRDYAERNGRRPDFLCPAMSSPAGFLSFAASSGGGESESAPRMSVLDGMRACACENNPLDAILAGLPGPFGGSSCELGARLRCLREEDDDVGTPMSFECARLLAEDNQESLSSQLQQCGIISCGTDSWVTPDCRCQSMSSGGGGGGRFDACEQVLCPEGTVPRPNGYSCACTAPDEHIGPSIPGVECIPGFPCGGGRNPPPPPPWL